MSSYNYFKENQPISIKGSTIFDTVYKSIGNEIDKLSKDKDDLILQLNPQTCTWSIDMWEDMCSIEHSTQSLDIRRSQVVSKLSEITPITKVRMKAMLKPYVDGSIEIVNNIKPYTFKVVITGGQMPNGLNGLYDRVEEVKPYHLAVDYELVPVTNANIYCCAASISGETITVYPKEG